MPTLCVGLRGLVYTEIEAQGAKTDLHSGVYGGAAPIRSSALVEIISKLKDADGKVLIPGFYDAVQKPTDAELKAWAQPALQRRGLSQGRSRLQRADRRARLLGALSHLGASHAGSPRHASAASSLPAPRP